jgi:N-acetylglucosaminyl-diphospho-decaprenol L-rhamnosyltransferase
MILDVLVVNFNGGHLLAEFFRSVKAASENISINLLFFDNGSTDGSSESIRRNHPDVFLFVGDKNIGFGRGNNQLVQYLKGRYVLLLNTDAFVAPDSLSKTIDFMETCQDCGVLGVRLVGRDGGLQPSCRYFPTPLNVFLIRTGLGRFFPWVGMVDDMAWDHATVRECDWVPGCYYLIRREVIHQVGLFDPRFFLYYEEVDHCRRVKAAGWKVVYFPDTEVVHIGGESAKSAGKLTDGGRQLSALQVESELLYFRKHYGLPGIALHLLLVVLGDAFLALKHVVKGRWGVVPVCWKNHALTWHLFRATKWATCATR